MNHPESLRARLEELVSSGRARPALYTLADMSAPRRAGTYPRRSRRCEPMIDSRQAEAALSQGIEVLAPN